MADEPERPNRPPLAFDLTKAIEEARAEFPEETAGFTFVDISAPDAREKLTEWQNGAGPEFLRGRSTGLNEWLDCTLSVGGLVTGDETGRTLVCVRSAVIDGTVTLSDPGRTLAYIFAHELGHALVEGGHPKGIQKIFQDLEKYFDSTAVINRAESAADTFAALYGAKKGWLDRDDMKQVAAQVAAGAAFGLEFMHFTTLALEPLIVNAKGLDFKSLSLQEIRTVAARHAEECALNGDEISRSFTSVAKALHQLDRDAQKQPVEGGGEFQEEETSPEEESPEERAREDLDELAKIYAGGPPSPGSGKAFVYFLAQRVIDETLRTGLIPRTLWAVDVSAPEWDAVRRARESTSTALAENKADILPRGGARMRVVTFAAQPKT